MAPTDQGDAGVRAAEARRHMVDHDLRRRGIRDERVLAAMASVPRERFVPAGETAMAYDDRALPIGGGQTISQPYVVALMLEALELAGGEAVLEVGAGSGYVLALLDRLARRVVGIERVAALVPAARDALDAVGATSVALHVGDGTLGWSEDAPYDAILVSAGGRDVPPTLLGQLAPGGRLVMPVGSRTSQRLVRARRTAAGIETEDLGGVVFVPLVGREGWRR